MNRLKLDPLCTGAGNVKQYKTLWKISWQFLKKLKIELYDEQFHSGYIPKRIEGNVSKILAHHFTAALFATAKTWKQPKCSLMNN